MQLYSKLEVDPGFILGGKYRSASNEQCYHLSVYRFYHILTNEPSNDNKIVVPIISALFYAFYHNKVVNTHYNP